MYYSNWAQLDVWLEIYNFTSIQMFDIEIHKEKV